MRIAWSIPGWGWALLLAAAVVCVGWAWRQYRRTEPAPTPRLRRLLSLLRIAALVLLLLAIAGPSLFRIRRQERPPEFAVLVDDSASMTIADGQGGATRWRRALRLAAVADSLLRRRDPGVRLTLLRGNGLGPARELDPAGADTALPRAVGTDLDGLVRDVAGRWADRPLRGLLRLTDGNATEEGALPAGVAAATAPPLFIAAGVGDPEGPPDLAIQDLRYPDTVYQGDRATAEVTVASRGAVTGAGQVTVRLRQGESVVAEATSAAPPSGGVVTLELTFRPAGLGLQVYELEVQPLDNERFLANNRATLAVDVHKGRARVLLLAGRPGWDSRFLAQGVAAEQRLALEVVRRGRSGLVLADSGRAWTSPRDAAGWRRWDGVALAGWQDLRDAVDWPSLAAAVEGGLGLLVVPTEGEEGGGEGPGRLAPVPPALAGLLPVETAGAIWQGGQWLPTQTPAGAEHPLLSGVTTDVAPGAGLDNGRFPPLVRVLAVAARPGAETLLAAAPLRGGAASGTAPLLVVRRVGSGRVAWFGGRRLWELAFWEPPQAGGSEESHPGRRLLRNLMVWTASGDEQTGLRLVGHRQVYQEGERIRLEAQWRDLRGQPVTDRPQALLLRSLAGAFGERTFALTPVAGAPGHAAADLPPLPPGRYTVTPISGDEPRESGPAQTFVVAAQSLEAAQTRQDRRALRSLAARLDGTYLAGEAPDAAGRLASLLDRVRLEGDARTLRRRWDLWASWPLVAVVFGLLAAEWILRRNQGML